MITQIKIDGVWADGEPTEDGQECRIKIPVGNSFGYEYKRHSTRLEVERKIVNASELGELLPDAVILELEDFRSDKAEAPAKRRAAARILLRIESNLSINVFGQKFLGMMSKIETNTSLTAEQKAGILSELQS